MATRGILLDTTVKTTVEGLHLLREDEKRKTLEFKATVADHPISCKDSVVYSLTNEEVRLGEPIIAMMRIQNGITKIVFERFDKVSVKGKLEDKGTIVPMVNVTECNLAPNEVDLY